MGTEEEWTAADREQALAETREKLEAIELEWKEWRRQSRNLSLELITVNKYSVANVSRLSGHHRGTITLWLQVWNAEHKNR
jgi:hypothetical protein